MGIDYGILPKLVNLIFPFLAIFILPTSPAEGFNKQIKRACKKSIQFVTEEALEKRLVTMFLHYNEGMSRRKVREWRIIVELMGKEA